MILVEKNEKTELNNINRLFNLIEKSDYYKQHTIIDYENKLLRIYHNKTYLNIFTTLDSDVMKFYSIDETEYKSLIFILKVLSELYREINRIVFPKIINEEHYIKTKVNAYLSCLDLVD